LVLSVGIRQGPVTTVVNGTLVARPARMTPGTRSHRCSTLAGGWGPSSVSPGSWARLG
jgi:hypothetical protein